MPRGLGRSRRAWLSPWAIHVMPRLPWVQPHPPSRAASASGAASRQSCIATGRGERLRMNKSDVRVSVVVPAFNARATIYPAVRSGLQQTQDGVEVLVVDDASTDGTTDAVLPLASRDSR